MIAPATALETLEFTCVIELFTLLKVEVSILEQVVQLLMVVFAIVKPVVTKPPPIRVIEPVPKGPETTELPEVTLFAPATRSPRYE